MKSLGKIRELPLKKRKAILWSFVAVIGIILFAFWAKETGERLEILKKEGAEKGFGTEELREELREKLSDISGE
jgi:hypothetical protein